MGWLDLVMGGLGAASAAGGITQAIQGQSAYEAQQRFARQQRAIQAQQMAAETSRRGRLETLSQQPISASQFYAPMSDAETAALRRSIAADLASRGIPWDSSYATNLAGEIMARTESQRQQAAFQQAVQARQTAQSGLSNAIPGFYTPGGPPSPSSTDYAGGMRTPLAYFANKYGQPGQGQAPAGGRGAVPDPSMLADLYGTNPFGLPSSWYQGGQMPSTRWWADPGGTISIGGMAPSGGGGSAPWQNAYSGVPMPSQMGPGAYADWSAGLPRADFGGVGGMPY